MAENKKTTKKTTTKKTTAKVEKKELVEMVEKQEIKQVEKPKIKKVVPKMDLGIFDKLQNILMAHSQKIGIDKAKAYLLKSIKPEDQISKDFEIDINLNPIGMPSRICAKVSNINNFLKEAESVKFAILKDFGYNNLIKFLQ